MNNITNKVLCAGLRTTCLGNTLTDDEVTREVLVKHNAVKGSLRVTKTRLKDALEPFRKLRGEARRYFNSESLPGISEDLRIIPSSRLERVREKVREFNDRDAALLAELQQNYSAEIEKDRALLGDRFDISLYPSPDMLGQHFSIQLTVCDLPSGDYSRIAGLDETARERMRAEHDAMLVQVGVNARSEVMRKLTDLIQNVAEKMADPDVERYRNSTFDNLKAYLDQVQELNVTNDPIIEGMRAAAAEKLNTSMDVVKKSDVLKAKIAADARDILNRFGTVQRKLLPSTPAAPESEKVA
jgi:hypothetical protein